MSSRTQQEISAEPSEIAKFYHGKSLFITGAAGFLGVVLLETFLRCCPDIRRIYILLRSKKGVKPEDRKEAIFKKEIFSKLKEKDPDALEKVVVVSGDVTQDDLGMNEDALLEVTREVSVVFHCAAAISFLKPLSFMLNQNVIGTYNVIELCRKIENLQALVYTSTAFSNTNRKTEIEEKVYSLPFSIDEALRLTRNGNNDELNRLFLKCDPEFPNYYTFSKCLAENLIAEKTSDLPVAVVRPSIIVCTLKGVMPGYIEYGSGIVSLSIGIGKGFIRVLRVDASKRTDHIPVDVVANTHIAAGYFQAEESLPSPFIYNCTSSEQSPYTWGEFINALMQMVLKYPLPKSYQRPSLTMCKNLIKYKLFSVLDHYIPAIVIDILLWISGSKLSHLGNKHIRMIDLTDYSSHSDFPVRLYKLYQFYDKNVRSLEYFMLNEWDFKSENFRTLQKKLNSTDAEVFFVDLKDFNLEVLTKNLRIGAPVYRRNKDSKPVEESIRTAYLRSFFTSFIKWSVLGGVASILYMAIF